MVRPRQQMRPMSERGTTRSRAAWTSLRGASRRGRHDHDITHLFESNDKTHTKPFRPEYAERVGWLWRAACCAGAWRARHRQLHIVHGQLKSCTFIL